MKIKHQRILMGLLTSLIYISQSYAQTNEFLPVIIPPSPEAVALGKYGNFPVSNYSGTPNISIPIYQIQSRDLSVPISLSYHASGIKVNEEASWVGLGWTLQAGGVISRSVMGVDDFASNSGSYHNNAQIPDIESTLVSNGWGQTYLTSEACVGDIAELDCATSGYFNRSSGYDFEPDQYSYNMPGGSGKFILRRDKTAVLAEKDKVKIEHISEAAGWKITIADGSIYEFEEFETTQDQNELSVKSAWYLTKINSPLKEVVTFNYDKETQFNLVTIGEVSEQKSHDALSCVSFNGFTNPVQRTYKMVTLTSIDFNNGRVEFSYDGNRSDLDGGKKLLSVKVFKKDSAGNPLSSPMKQFDLDYDYFIGTGDEDYQFNVTTQSFLTHRLKLKSVTEKAGGLTNPPYQFEYLEGGNNTMPSKASFAKDHWGYYNGRLSNQTLIPAYSGMVDYGGGAFLYQQLSGANRDPNPQYSQAFTLNKIVYPTGGSTSFTYENHDYDLQRSRVNDMSPAQAESTVRDTAYSFNAYSGQTKILVLDLSNGHSPQFNVPLNLTTTFRCFSGCDQVSGVNAGDILFGLYYDSAATNPVPQTDIDFTDGTAETSCVLNPEILCEKTDYYELPAGKYYWKATVSSAANFDGVFARYSWSENVEATDPEKQPFAGGLRIMEMIETDSVDSTNTQYQKFIYNYNDDGGVKSYGILQSKPSYERYWQDITSNGGTSTGCYTFVRTSNSTVPLNSTTAGSAVGYDMVKVLYGKNAQGEYGVYGKTEFQYQNDPVIVFNYADTREPGMLDAQLNGNGLLMLKRDYKYNSGNYQIVTMTINQYARVSASTLRRPEIYSNNSRHELIYGIRLKKLVNSEFENGFMLYYYPAIHSEWIRHHLSVTLHYDPDDTTKYAGTAIQYTFEPTPKHYQPLTKLVAGSGGSVLSTFKYPEDYDYATTSTAIKKLVDKFQVSQPLEVFERNRSVVNGDVGVTSATATEFTYDASSDLVIPNKIYRLNTNVPIPNFSGTTNGTDFSSYEERAIYHEYDDKGNALEVSKSDDVRTVYLWGYNQTLPIAQIVNATYSDVETILGSNFHGGWDGFNGNQEDSLRNGLPNSMVTTYEYDPLVGVISSTDPRGLTTTYEYDDLNRLEWIIDHQDNIAKKFEYQFDNDGTQ